LYPYFLAGAAGWSRGGADLLRHDAALDNGDRVRRAHGAEAVRDHDGRAAARGEQPVNGRLHEPLALRVERRGRLRAPADVSD